MAGMRPELLKMTKMRKIVFSEMIQRKAKPVFFSMFVYKNLKVNIRI